MHLFINGDEKTFEGQLSLAQLIEQLGMKGDPLAVELNREIVARAQWAETQLNDGDRLEIVHFVLQGRDQARRVYYGAVFEAKRKFLRAPEQY